MGHCSLHCAVILLAIIECSKFYNEVVNAEESLGTQIHINFNRKDDSFFSTLSYKNGCCI